MSNTRKIAGSVNLRIRLGDFEHLEFVKYSEEQITFENDAERTAQEDKLNADLMDALMRSVKTGFKTFGMDGTVAQEIEQKVEKRLPEWLEKGEIPNIANQNQAEKRLNQVADKQQDEVDKQQKTAKTVKETFAVEEPVVSSEIVVETTPVVVGVTKSSEPTASPAPVVSAVKDLFEVDDPPAKALVEDEKPVEASKPTAKVAKNLDDFSILDDDDDDLFKTK